MSTISEHAPPTASEEPRWRPRLLVRDMWASLAIVSMWLAVLFDALFGPDVVSSSVSGTTTTIPSAVIVALFAYLGTRVVARYGFDRSRDT
jgi:ABC-type antimicrobial peptide transport system permease subunit